MSTNCEIRVAKELVNEITKTTSLDSSIRFSREIALKTAVKINAWL